MVDQAARESGANLDDEKVAPAFFERLSAQVKERFPSGERILFKKDPGAKRIPYLVSPEIVASRSDLSSLRLNVERSEGSLEGLLFTFKPEAARRIEEVTRENKGSRLALIFWDEVLAAPIIQESIRGGEITFLFPKAQQLQMMIYTEQSVPGTTSVRDCSEDAKSAVNEG